MNLEEKIERLWFEAKRRKELIASNSIPDVDDWITVQADDLYDLIVAWRNARSEWEADFIKAIESGAASLRGQKIGYQIAEGDRILFSQNESKLLTMMRVKRVIKVEVNREGHKDIVLEI